MKYLGSDIWMQILSALSVKDLIRFKSVSKTFLDLISNDYFIRLHLNKSSLRAIHLNKHTYLCLKQHGEAESSLRGIYINNYEWKRDVDVIMTISYGSCNGLVCLWPIHNVYVSGVFLWNPSLREAECVPIKKPSMSSCQFGWFGYDNDEYKLILGTDSHIHLIRLYIDTDSWKSSLKIHTNYHHRETIGTLVHRTVHWPEWYYGDHENTIISYDLRNETFGKIGMPVFGPFVLGQVDGCLSAMLSKHYKVELWVMKEYGVEETWTKLMILPSEIMGTYRGLNFMSRV